jgi:formamidopyrimidine-DNA glycosylase
MPELPDIEAYRSALAARVVGSALTSAEVHSPFLLRTVTPAPRDVVGQRVKAVGRLGKRVVLSFDSDVHFVFHLMIAGRFKWADRDASKEAREPASKRGGPKRPSPRSPALLTLGFETGHLTLTEVSKKKRAKLHVVQGDAALAEHDPGGLEPLGSHRDAFVAALTDENHTVKRALTDPRVLSGIGNAYSDEILHRAQLPPTRWTSRLSDAELTRLHDATQAVLVEFRDRMLLELDGAFPSKVTAFRPDMAVHGRYGQPCPVCQEKVQRIRYANNETNYCARCQNEGKLLADRSLSRLLKADWPKTLEELEDLKRGGSVVVPLRRG